MQRRPEQQDADGGRQPAGAGPDPEVLPIVSADIPEFRDMAEAEGIAIEFYRTGDARSLARALIRWSSAP